MRTLLLLLFFILISSVSSQVCDSAEFFNGQRCVACKTNCQCSEQHGCSSCLSGYTYDSKFENCVQCPTTTDSVNVGCKECCFQIKETAFVCSSCPDLSYTFLIGGQCLRLMGCNSLSQSGICQSCDSGYYLLNGKCNACHVSCTTCTDANYCLTCSEGYFNGTNAHLGLCVSCSTGCSQCSSQTVCTTCSEGYYLSSSSCTACASNCLSCTSSVCSSCQSGYAVIAGICTACTSIADGGSLGCVLCHSQVGTIKCDSCSSGFYLASNQKCFACSSVYSNSQLCISSQPLQCTSDDHASLQLRYLLVSNTCVLNSNSCRSMTNLNGECSDCYFENPYYYRMDGSICTKCQKPGCAVFSTSCTCLSCLSGYQFINSQCIVCQNPHCYTCQADVTACEECAPHYGISSSACISCSQTHCLNCDGDSSLCNTCEDAYYVSSGICYNCQTSCAICTSSTSCTTCNAGYYIDSSGRCKSLPSNCEEVDVSGLCTKCSYGYLLGSGNCFSCSANSFNLHQCQRYCPSYYALLVWEKQLIYFPILVLLSMLLF